MAFAPHPEDPAYVSFIHPSFSLPIPSLPPSLSLSLPPFLSPSISLSLSLSFSLITYYQLFTTPPGAQKKVMHNVRIIRGHPLNFCKHKRGGLGNVGAGPNPERLQTAMSLYSNKLSALIMMVDSKISSLVGIKEGL